MMGGGHGGCTISLVQCGKEKEIQNILREKYQEKFGFEPNFLLVNINDGICKF